LTLGLLAAFAPFVVQSSFGQQVDTQPGEAPIATRPPAPMACKTTSPYLSLSTTAPFMTDLVAWWAEGFPPGTLVSWSTTDLLSGALVARGSVSTDSFCNVSGSFRLPVPSGYHFELRGTTNGTGEPVVLSAFPRAVVLPPVSPTPTPPSRPAEPTYFNVIPVNANTIRFDWVDNSNNETAFVITSRTGNINRPANSNSYNQGGFATNDVYCFSLFAVNDAGPAYGGTDCALLVSEEFRESLPPPPNLPTRP
jgi:hypothetical protein